MDPTTLARRTIVAATFALAVAACAAAPQDAGQAAPLATEPAADAAVASARPVGTGDRTTVATYRGNPSRTGEMAGPGPAGQPAVAWQFDAGGPFANSPVVGDGTVFAASGDGGVHALDLLSGDPRWSVSVGADVSASPLLVGRLVIVPDEHGVVHALSAADGSPAWTVETDGGAITGSPATVGDDIIVATRGTHAYRMDAATGDIVWSVDAGDPTTRSVTVDDATAYLGLEGDILAIALADGAARWRATVATTGSVGTPTVAGDLVYAATGLDGNAADAGVAAIDAASGAVRWRYASPTQAQVYTPAVVDGRAFVLGHDGLLVALDAASGASLWTRDLEVELEALPSIVDDTVYVVGNDGPASALDAATGDTRWSVPIVGVPFAPAIAGGYLLVGTDVGHLYAIGGS